MLNHYAKRSALGAASAAILIASSFAVHAQTNINLAVASNFYGFPPPNSAITDLIAAFQAKPGYTVTVVDNGKLLNFEANIINGKLTPQEVRDLFLAADTETSRLTHKSL